MDKGVMEFLNGDLVACLDEGVVVCLDNNNKDYFYVDIRHNLDACCFCGIAVEGDYINKKIRKEYCDAMERGKQKK